MNGISTHVLDTSIGRPAAAVGVRLLRHESDQSWRRLAEDRTDADGRVRQLLPEGEALAAGHYQLQFDTGAYFAARNVVGLYPQVTITIAVSDTAVHYHIPLLLSPHGYTTYRGS